MNKNYLLVIAFFYLSGCSHFILNDTKKLQLSNSSDFNYSKKICIRNGFDIDHSFVFDEKYAMFSKVQKKLASNGIEIDCSDKSILTVVYQHSSGANSYGLFILTIGLFPMISEDKYEIKTYFQNKLKETETITGVKISSTLLIPFFFLLNDEAEVVYGYILRTLIQN